MAAWVVFITLLSVALAGSITKDRTTTRQASSTTLPPAEISSRSYSINTPNLDASSSGQYFSYQSPEIGKLQNAYTAGEKEQQSLPTTSQQPKSTTINSQQPFNDAVTTTTTTNTNKENTPSFTSSPQTTTTLENLMKAYIPYMNPFYPFGNIPPVGNFPFQYTAPQRYGPMYNTNSYYGSYLFPGSFGYPNFFPYSGTYQTQQQHIVPPTGYTNPPPPQRNQLNIPQHLAYGHYYGVPYGQQRYSSMQITQPSQQQQQFSSHNQQQQQPVIGNQAEAQSYQSYHVQNHPLHQVIPYLASYYSGRPNAEVAPNQLKTTSYPYNYFSNYPYYPGYSSRYFGNVGPVPNQLPNVY